MAMAPRSKKRIAPVAQKTSRRDRPYRAQEQRAEPNIIFDEIVPHDGYVTGVAHYADPNGLGQFTVNVSGANEDAITHYAQRARIVRLQISPLFSDDDAALKKRRRAATAYWRKVWQERLNRLRKIIHDAKPDLLADPDKLWKTARNLERAEEGSRSRIDWRFDQIIEIKPEGNLPKGGRYALSFEIDPPLGAFESYHYSLQNPGDWYLAQVQGSVAAQEGTTAYRSERESTILHGVSVWEYAGGNAYYSISVDGIYYS